MELGFVFGLGAITLAVIAMVICFGMMLNRALNERTLELNMRMNITPSGNVVFACMVAFWIYCAATRQLSPESDFETFLGTADGVVAVFVVSIVFGGIAGALLDRIGFPIAKRDDDS